MAPLASTAKNPPGRYLQASHRGHHQFPPPRPRKSPCPQQTPQRPASRRRQASFRSYHQGFPPAATANLFPGRHRQAESPSPPPVPVPTAAIKVLPRRHRQGRPPPPRPSLAPPHPPSKTPCADVEDAGATAPLPDTGAVLHRGCRRRLGQGPPPPPSAADGNFGGSVAQRRVARRRRSRATARRLPDLPPTNARIPAVPNAVRSLRPRTRREKAPRRTEAPYIFFRSVS